MIDKSLPSVSLALVILFGVVACSDAGSNGGTPGGAKTTVGAAATYSTLVDAQGTISRPQGYAETWMHIGTWTVANEGGAGNGMHHVYTTPDVVEHYKKDGTFPDGAVLVKEVRNSRNAPMTTGQAHWATTPNVWFVMVKDTKGRFPDNPLWGDGWGWALFKADDPNTQVATEYKTDCLGCHIPAKRSDWVYTYGYQRVLGSKSVAFEPPAPDEETAGEP